MAEQAPAHWVRVQTLVDRSGWPAVMVMAGRPELPVALAEGEAKRLRNMFDARVLRDLTGRPCVHLADPGVQAWLDELDDRVTETAAALERYLEVPGGTS